MPLDMVSDKATADGGSATGAARSPFPSRRTANITLALLLAAYICSYLDRQILSLMVGPVKSDLGISDFQMSLLQGLAFGLFFAFAGVPIGWLADRTHRARLIAAGVLLWGLMTIACGLSNSFEALFLARIGLGIGEAALAPAGFSLLADTFDEKRLVRATGIFASGGILGGGLAFFLGGLLLDWLNNSSDLLAATGLAAWQLAFILISIPGLLLVIPLAFLPEPVRRGAVEASPRFSETCAYIWTRRRDFAPFYLTPTLLGIANYSGLAWFPTHMIRYFHLTPREVGVYLGMIQLVASVVGMLGGAILTEQLARRGKADAHLRTVFVISILMVIGISATLVSYRPLAFVLWFFAVVSFSGYFGSIVAAMQIMTPPQMRSSNSALLLMAIMLGGLTLGSAMVGAVADIFFLGMDRGVGLSLFIVGSIAALLSAVVAWRGLPRFAATMSARNVE